MMFSVILIVPIMGRQYDQIGFECSKWQILGQNFGNFLGYFEKWHFLGK